MQLDTPCFVDTLGGLPFSEQKWKSELGSAEGGEEKGKAVVEM